LRFFQSLGLGLGLEGQGLGLGLGLEKKVLLTSSPSVKFSAGELVPEGSVCKQILPFRNCPDSRSLGLMLTLLLGLPMEMQQQRTTSR
jgi:hypothetical protein